jgi:hypothetical protein
LCCSAIEFVFSAARTHVETDYYFVLHIDTLRLRRAKEGSAPGTKCAMPTLKIQSGIRDGEVIELAGELITIGSAPGNTIEFNDAQVAPLHATLVRGDGTYVLSDQQSSAGTFVNGVKIAERKLRRGDQICLGGIRMLYKAGIKPAEPRQSAAEKGTMIAPTGANRRRGMLVLAIFALGAAGWVLFQLTPPVADAPQQGATALSGGTSLPATSPIPSPSLTPAEPAAPVFPAGRTPQATAEEILLPWVDFKEATVREAIDYLRKKSKELDIEHKDSLVLLRPNAGADAKITLSLRNVTILDALKHVVELADLELRAEPFALVVQPATSPRPEILKLPPVPEPGTPEAALMDRAKKLILPQLAWHETTTDEGVNYLRVRSAQFDPDGLGVNIVVKHSAKSRSARISIAATDVTVNEMLVRLAQLSGLELGVHASAFYLHPPTARVAEPLPPSATPAAPFESITPIPMPRPPGLGAPRASMVTTPAVTLSWQRAMIEDPDLGTVGSDLQRAFGSVVRELKAAESPLLQQDDWPQLAAAEAKRRLTPPRR